MGFVDCFVGEKEEDEIYEELEDYLSYEFTETEKVEIRNLYLFIKYGYSATDKITGIPGEAFNDATFAQLMQEATKYIGFPYQWGGSTPETSFDCSGFVCWVWQKMMEPTEIESKEVCNQAQSEEMMDNHVEEQVVSDLELEV